jgi:hypothetical protein
VETLVHAICRIAVGLTAFNALVFVALYTRKARPELLERYRAWALQSEFDLAEGRTTNRARSPDKATQSLNVIAVSSTGIDQEPRHTS